MNTINQLSRLQNETPLSGVFKHTIAEFGARKIVLVTCIDNQKGNEGYDPQGNCIAGSYFEIHDGSDVYTHRFGSYLKAQLKALIESDGAEQSGDVLGSDLELVFLAELNKVIGNPQIRVYMNSDGHNYYTLRIDSPYVNGECVKPSDELVKVIKELSMSILGKPPVFDNLGKAFWFN